MQLAARYWPRPDFPVLVNPDDSPPRTGHGFGTYVKIGSTHYRCSTEGRIGSLEPRKTRWHIIASHDFSLPSISRRSPASRADGGLTKTLGPHTRHDQRVIARLGVPGRTGTRSRCSKLFTVRHPVFLLLVDRQAPFSLDGDQSVDFSMADGPCGSSRSTIFASTDAKRLFPRRLRRLCASSDRSNLRRVRRFGRFVARGGTCPPAFFADG